MSKRTVLIGVALWALGMAGCTGFQDPTPEPVASEPGSGAPDEIEAEDDGVTGAQSTATDPPVVRELARGSEWTSLAVSGGSMWIATPDGFERLNLSTGVSEFVHEDSSGGGGVDDCGDGLLAAIARTGQAGLFDVRSNRYLLRFVDEHLGPTLPDRIRDDQVTLLGCHGPLAVALLATEGGEDRDGDLFGDRRTTVAVGVDRDGFHDATVLNDDAVASVRSFDELLLVFTRDQRLLVVSRTGEGTIDVQEAPWRSCPCIEYDGSVWLAEDEHGDATVDRLDALAAGEMPAPISLRRLDGSPDVLRVPVTEGVLYGDAAYLTVGDRLFLLDGDELLEVDPAGGEFIGVTPVPGSDELIEVVPTGDQVLVLTTTSAGRTAVYEIALMP